MVDTIPDCSDCKDATSLINSALPARTKDLTKVSEKVTVFERYRTLLQFDWLVPSPTLHL